MSTTHGTSAASDRTDAETEDTGEQENTEDNQIEKEVTLHDEDEDKEGRSELNSLREDIADSQVYTATSLSAIPNETKTKTHPLVMIP